MASPQTNNLIAKKVCWSETGAIAFIIALSWFDEILDIPHVLLGGAATPINWRESFFESVVIAVVGALITGVGQELSVPFVGPSYKIAVAFALLLVTLLLRPAGLFGRQELVR